MGTFTLHSQVPLIFCDLTLYTELFIGSSGRTYMPEKFEGIPRNMFTEMRLWIIDNCRHDVVFYVNSNTSPVNYYLYFASQEDMALFKLSKWGSLTPNL